MSKDFHTYAVLPALLAALASYAPQTAAAEAAAIPHEPGKITIVRSIPAHSAFRPGPLGVPTNVPTARPDLINGSTGTLRPSIAAVSDAALGDIGSQVSAGVAGVASAPAGSAAPLYATATAAATRETGAAPAAAAGMAPLAGAGAMLGGTLTRAMAPMNGALGALGALRGGK